MEMMLCLICLHTTLIFLRRHTTTSQRRYFLAHRGGLFVYLLLSPWYLFVVKLLMYLCSLIICDHSCWCADHFQAVFLLVSEYSLVFSQCCICALQFKWIWFPNIHMHMGTCNWILLYLYPLRSQCWNCKHVYHNYRIVQRFFLFRPLRESLILIVGVAL